MEPFYTCVLQLLREIRVESQKTTLVSLRFPVFFCYSKVRNTLKVFSGLQHLVFSFLGWEVYANSYTITENFEASNMSFHSWKVDRNLAFSFNGFLFPVQNIALSLTEFCFVEITIKMTTLNNNTALLSHPCWYCQFKPQLLFRCTSEYSAPQTVLLPEGCCFWLFVATSFI